jgi:pimeloyl-ACP methyl ester carboxylesterase
VVPVASVVAVDQSLQLGAFKSDLVAAEPLLRDPDQYRFVVGAMFEAMSGTLLSGDERGRIGALRRPDQAVILGVWDLLLTAPDDQIAAAVDTALAGYVDHPTPYLALFGIDPGESYASWLAERVPGGVVEIWADHGHYPHLVDPDRFVERLIGFWGD